jgi:hypothetical protein
LLAPCSVRIHNRRIGHLARARLTVIPSRSPAASSIEASAAGQNYEIGVKVPSPFRQRLPNLVIAGVTKAGTTSLHHYLAQHPDICPAKVKEVDYYAPMIEGAAPGPLSAYAAHFAACGEHPWRLDASPGYFIGGKPLAVQIAEDLDQPRVIIMLREPVSRLWSGYTYKRSKGRLPAGMTFPEFYEACLQAYEGGSVTDPSNKLFRTLATGVYANYLDDWVDTFGGALRLVFFENLVSSPAAELTSLFHWLGVDPAAVAGLDLKARNQTSHPKSFAMRHVAYALRARGGRLLSDSTRIGQVLRATYHRVNTGSMDERFGPDDRLTAELFYAPTLPPLRKILERAGGSELPGWLAGART